MLKRLSPNNAVIDSVLTEYGKKAITNYQSMVFA